MKFATENSQKFICARKAFQRTGINLIHANIKIPEIQASSSREVVMAKAAYVSNKLTGEFIVEDSSFHIASLHGFPGVYVKYVLSTLQCEGILKIMEHVNNRECYFESHIAHCGEGRPLTLYRSKIGGLFITDRIYESNVGWSEIWKIIGFTREHCHFSNLSESAQSDYLEQWEFDNVFSKFCVHTYG